MERFGVFRRFVVQEEMESEHWSSWSKPTRGRDHGIAYPRSLTEKASRREVEDAGSWTRAHKREASTTIRHWVEHGLPARMTERLDDNPTRVGARGVSYPRAR
ncbi:hypothetical protein F2Q70_00004058 [Brassica cretica]|uniref:Uncharacterized protein n=1 Tax=Brassica cretica TaxID=69181 RepID=A0A8S9IM96_BRACR|nr:hypothetical protein F2Q70_00004058 [Brassica cretica]